MAEINKVANASESSKPIVLVGLMGAGKTSVGKLLAKRLGMSFFDCDHEIERSTGVKVATIFEFEGEEGFRVRERRMLENLLKLNHIVLATGGGAVISKTNRELIATNGIVVYLRASAKLLLRRTRHDRNRPLLQVPDPYAKLESLLSEREPLYREVADITVDTGNQSLGTLATQIVDSISRLHKLDNRTAAPNAGANANAA